MYNAAETTSVGGATTTTTTTTTGTSVVTGDPLQFARELREKMAEETNTLAETLERMAAAFPGATITSQSIETFGEVKAHYTASSSNVSVNIGQDVLAQMAEDEEFAGRIREMVSEVLNSGQQQNLVSANGAATTRNVSVTADGVRYVEVQRGTNGSTMSVSSLATQATQSIADLLEELIEMLRSRRGGETATVAGKESSRTGSGGSGGASSGAASSSSFDWMLSSNSWRFESYLSASGVSSSSSSSSFSSTYTRITAQMVQQQSIEATVSQWVESGAKVDLQMYMEMVGLCDPLVLDLGGEGINLRSAEDGVYFDIKGDGTPVRTAFIQGKNAFLYLDGNGNGVADDVNELFGDHGGYANGFEKLAQYDDNGDGLIDENDAIYDRLRVWQDLNGDGVNQANESMGLTKAGVASINLNYSDKKELDAGGNVIGERSTFTRTDGSSGAIVDAWLRNLGS